MAENKQNTTPERRPDCVTEIRMGNTVPVSYTHLVWGRHSPTRFTKGGKTADLRILAPW